MRFNLRSLSVLCLVLCIGSETAGQPVPVCEVSVARSNGAQVALIVDDEAVIRTLLQMNLESRNYLVLSAASGAQAIELLDTVGSVDFAIIDVHLAGESGRDLAQTLTASRGIPCALMSGEFTGTAEGDGFVTITKPYTGAQLDAVVATLHPRSD